MDLDKILFTPSTEADFEEIGLFDDFIKAAGAASGSLNDFRRLFVTAHSSNGYFTSYNSSQAGNWTWNSAAPAAEPEPANTFNHADRPFRSPRSGGQGGVVRDPLAGNNFRIGSAGLVISEQIIGSVVPPIPVPITPDRQPNRLIARLKMALKPP